MPGRAKVEGVGEAKVDLPLSLPPLESVGKSAFTFVRSRRVLVGIVIVTAFRPQLIRAPSSFDRLLNRVSLHNRLEALAWLCQADTTLCCVKWGMLLRNDIGEEAELRMRPRSNEIAQSDTQYPSASCRYRSA